LWRRRGPAARRGSASCASGVTGSFPCGSATSISVHRAQGETYDAVNIISDDTFVPGHVYTELSRVKDVARMYIAPGAVTAGKIQVAKEVEEFYKEIENER